MTVPPSSEPGRIITFYSYKGGTGRSMAVANIACLLGMHLAKTSQRVLVMDWDLEAPGLHRFFSARCDLPEYTETEGVINYFRSLLNLLENSPGSYEKLGSEDGWKVLDSMLPLEKFLIPNVVPGVDFMRAGRFDPNYPKLVGTFDWIRFFDQYGSVIRTFREMLAEKFSYILVDSRTGITDVSGICTTLLPEKVVGVFVPNRQSLEGLCGILKDALDYRSNSDDFRPLSVFPLPSRIELAEKDLRLAWRRDYQGKFEALFQEEYELKHCDLTQYFDDVVLPHTSFYAYGESISFFQERPDAVSLSAAYQRFFDRLMKLEFPWESLPAEGATVISPSSAAPVRSVELKFDVYLASVPENSKEVARIKSELIRQGVSVFSQLDDIPPGENWAAATASAMQASKTIVVFVGQNGIGPWHDQQWLAVLENIAKEPSRRIIPVFLPKAPPLTQLRVPTFLSYLNWLDMSDGIGVTEMKSLAWAITGTRRVASSSDRSFSDRSLFRKISYSTAAAISLIGLIFGLRTLLHVGSTPVQESAAPAANSPVESKPNPPNQLPANAPEDVLTETWNKEPPIAAWCYQELGSGRSRAWQLSPGKFGAYCHWSRFNCEQARSGAVSASACKFISDLKPDGWGGRKPLPGGLNHSWYRINMPEPLPAPFPQVIPSKK